jgi:colanic acid/amylovoran biosynthesis glycosyltransferase
MRVLLVVGRFPEPSQTFIVSHFVGLVARGVDAHVLCSAGDERAWNAFPGLADRFAERVHVYAPREQPLATLRELMDSARRTRNAARLSAVIGSLPAPQAARRVLMGLQVLALAPDVIHFEFAVDAVGATWIGDAAQCPVVVSVRGYDVNYAGLEHPRFYDEVWARADAVHCLGQDLWQRAVRRGCPPDKPHRAIPPGIDIMRFYPGPARPDSSPFVVLTVARLHWKKGYDYGLAAIRELVDAGVDVEYRVVGSGPEEPAIRAAAVDLGLTRRVRLLGDRLHDAVLAELHAADVLMHPAVSEGFCNAVLEAQAAALPVVCSDADGLAENVADGITGVVVPRRDAKALAAALARLAADPELRRRMGEAGRRRVIERFDSARQIQGFVDLYEEVSRRHAGIRVAPQARAGRGRCG